MNLLSICDKINKLRISDESEDFELCIFFDEIGESISNLNVSSKSEKSTIIKTLFSFLKNQDPEMDEDFSFIHLIESIDKPTSLIYNDELLKFSNEYGTLTSVLLLLRQLNSSSLNNKEIYIKTLKDISNKKEFKGVVRETALEYYNIHNINK